MSPMICDLILAILIAVCCIVGYCKGFVRSLLGFAGVFIALIVALTFSSPLGDWANRSFAEDAVSGVISEQINTAFQEDREAGERLFSVIDRFVFSPDADTGHYVDRIEEQGNSAIDSVSHELARAISVPLCSTLAFTVLFFVINALIRVLIRVLDRVCSLPVLNTANRALGLLFGALDGILVAMVLARVFVAVLPWLSQTFPDLFSAGMIEHATVLRFFSKFNLFATLISGISDVIK